MHKTHYFTYYMFLTTCADVQKTAKQHLEARFKPTKSYLTVDVVVVTKN